MVRRVEAGNRRCPSPQITTPSTHGARHPPPTAQARKSRLADRPCPRPHQGSTCASTGPPLPGSLRGSGGGSEAGPGAAGTRLGPSAHGEECSFLCLARPARAAQRTQAWLNAKPEAWWGQVL